MNERHGPLLLLATARGDAARSQITLGKLVMLRIKLQQCFVHHYLLLVHFQFNDLNNTACFSRYN